MKNYNKGFTLIELLVVIAIIGILASVVLASLNSARGKAKVAAFKSETAALVPAAIAYCDDNAGGNYEFGAGSTIDAGTVANTGAIACASDGTVVPRSISANTASGLTCTAALDATGAPVTCS